MVNFRQTSKLKRASLKQKIQRALAWALFRVKGSGISIFIESSEDLTKALKMYELSRAQLEIVLTRELKKL